MDSVEEAKKKPADFVTVGELSKSLGAKF
jgi:hypothetical protein